jgi:hypothetical protein
MYGGMRDEKIDQADIVSCIGGRFINNGIIVGLCQLASELSGFSELCKFCERWEHREHGGGHARCSGKMAKDDHGFFG